MLLDAINPYEEIIKYELLWATVKNANFQTIKEAKESLFDDESTQKRLKNFSLKLIIKTFL